MTANTCKHCNGEGWHMARKDSVWFPANDKCPEPLIRLCWNACGHCNPDGNQFPIPTISYEEFLKRKRGER